MSDQFELKEGQGSLWHESNRTVVRKGKIKIKGQDRYSAILKYKHSDGSEKYELVFSAGLLWVNNPDEKLNENSPDIKGTVSFNFDDLQSYKFGGWRNIRDNGEEWTGVRMTPKEEEDDYPFPKKANEKDEQDTEDSPF